MAWNTKQIVQHTEAAKKLCEVKNAALQFISEHTKNVSEQDVIDEIKKLYKKFGLINDHKKEFCIVAFAEHTKEVHYFPTKKTNSKLTSGSLILIDLWARLNTKDAPYADITWMAFYTGSQHKKTTKNTVSDIQKKVPKKIQQTWNILYASREKAISTIQEYVQHKKLPRGVDIDRASHDIIGNAKLAEGIKHTIGHSLGTKHPHGEIPGINWREYSSLIKNMGYTIEPGIYLEKEKFGMRTEIDFYINKNLEIVVTTDEQKEITLL